MHKHGIRVHKGRGFKPGSPCRLQLLSATHNRRGYPTAYELYDGIPTSFVKLNVTSRQTRESPDCVFSPLLFERMEADWQGCKKYEGIDFKKYLAWWGRMKHKGSKCPRRCSMVKKNSLEVGYVCPESGEVLVDKVEARERIYARLYREKVLETEQGKRRLADFRALMQEFKDRGEGLTIVVKDIDGPRDEDGRESWCEYNARVHEEKLNDLRFSFGHGYCVAQVLERIGAEVFGCE